MWWGIVGATGVIWSACYLLWMYQRVFFGQVKHAENNSLPDLDLREQVALWPAAVMALIMGIAPLWWLNAIDPAIHNVLASFSQLAAKAVTQ
jgi:NADH-quinone oxidoreductase subunit M